MRAELLKKTPFNDLTIPCLLFVRSKPGNKTLIFCEVNVCVCVSISNNDHFIAYTVARYGC